jgi:hypothetical protein
MDALFLSVAEIVDARYDVALAIAGVAVAFAT